MKLYSGKIRIRRDSKVRRIPTLQRKYRVKKASYFWVFTVHFSLKLPESNVDGDATLALSLQLVQDPRVLDGIILAHLKVKYWRFNSET